MLDAHVLNAHYVPVIMRWSTCECFGLLMKICLPLWLRKLGWLVLGSQESFPAQHFDDGKPGPLRDGAFFGGCGCFQRIPHFVCYAHSNIWIFTQKFPQELQR